MIKKLFILSLLYCSLQTVAAETTPECNQIPDNTLRLSCFDLKAAEEREPLTGTVLDYRIRQEESSIDSSFSLVAHRPTYFLPFAYVKQPDPFADAVATSGAQEKDLDNLEVKFQISFRVPVNRNFFIRNSHLWFGYTQLSLWQLYNSGDSKPFRETNYEPELIWSFLVNESFGDLKLTHLALALNHESNGQSEPLSRSWNRIYVNSIWVYDNWVLGLRPWYRIPESSGDDDNPDIEDYMGHFDFRAGYKKEDHQLSTLFRRSHNSGNPHSFYELGYSFSINRKFRGYIQFVSGYGETLIDYNNRNKRISLGIMLNDWF